MNNKVISPSVPRVSTYNMPPEMLKKRAYELDGMVGVRIGDLFPDVGQPVEGNDRDFYRQLALKALENFDLSKIQPNDSVNILTSHHGYSIYGGEAYAELVRTIRDAVEERCKTSNIYLKAGNGLRFRETDEYIKKHELDKYFHGKAAGVAPVDKGIAIETDIGTLYGIEQVYSAKWIIHVHNNDVRELHYHRQIGRLFKPFAMSYATIETRSSFHQSMGPRSSNLLARMIFESEFVQSKFIGSVMLQVGPAGIMGIDACNDLVKQDKEFAKLNLRWYGKLITLLNKIQDAVLVIDYPGPVPYTTAGGILFGNYLNANVDEFDLDTDFLPFTRYSDMLYPGPNPICPDGLVPPPNPSIKALIINYSSKGYPGTFFAQQLPTFVVGEQANVFRDCEQNQLFMNYALEVEDLDKAVSFAKKMAKTKNVLVFDGAIGGFNVSKELAEFLFDKASEISEEVDNKLMPKWLRQRGIE